MRRSSLLLLLIGSAAAAAACSGSSLEEPLAGSAEQDLTGIDLQCRAGAASFEVRPAAGGTGLEGKLSQGTASTTFECRDPAAGDSPAVVATCLERPQTVHPGRWRVDVTKTGAVFAARLIRSEQEPEVTFACVSGEPAADGGTDATADASPTEEAVPTFGEVQPILADKCSGCHQDAFATLDRVKAKRQRMFALISAGRMPRFQPTWKDTDDGKKVLAFLERSPELQ